MVQGWLWLSGLGLELMVLGLRFEGLDTCRRWTGRGGEEKKQDRRGAGGLCEAGRVDGTGEGVESSL
eukprot:233926-Rhodomonas_salina.1